LNSPDPIIRTAVAADIPAIIRLERSAAEASHWSERQYQGLISEASPRIALVVERRSEIVGFLVSRSGEKEWEVENLVVAPSARRAGLARQLLSELIAQAQNAVANRIVLEVRESNRGARSLYAVCGFQPVGRRKSYYRDPGEDAIVYELKLH